MSNYFDDLLDQILEQRRYPIGRSMKITVDGEERDVPIAERYQDQNKLRTARMEASLGEDAMLRHQLGSKRKRRGEAQGTYSEAWYPGIDQTVWSMKRGMGPSWFSQAMAKMSPEEKRAFQERLKFWGNRQGAMMDTVPGRAGSSGAHLVNPIHRIGRGF